MAAGKAASRRPGRRASCPRGLFTLGALLLLLVGHHIRQQPIAGGYGDLARPGHVCQLSGMGLFAARTRLSPASNRRLLADGSPGRGTRASCPAWGASRWGSHQSPMERKVKPCAGAAASSSRHSPALSGAAAVVIAVISCVVGSSWPPALPFHLQL